MGNDLPDYQTEVATASVEATSFRSGLDADKPASPAAGDIWLARDTYKLYVCNVAGAWMDIGYWRDDVTQSQPSRALTTVYQNTSGKIRAVAIEISNSNMGANYIYIGAVYCDSAETPITQVASAAMHTVSAIGGTGYWRATLTFLVPPDYYYKLIDESGGGGAISVDKWTEYNLL